MGRQATEDKLEENHALYFEPLEGARVLPLDSLVARKPPDTQSEYVANAAVLMRAAAAGETARRKPITVRPLQEGRYLIVDGNATYGAALRAGWSSIPTTVEDT